MVTTERYNGYMKFPEIYQVDVSLALWGGWKGY
jgi:hypothetical protein